MRIDYYVEGRVFEWLMGCSMLYHGSLFAFCPNSIEESGFRHLLWIVSPYQLVGLLVFLGWTRCSALMLNGQVMFGVKLGPFVRAAVSFGSSFIWGQMAVMAILISIERGGPIQGAYYWVMFTICEIYVTYTTLKNR